MTEKLKIDTEVWLTFILSETNHRLSHGQPWVEALLTLAHEHGFALMYKD